MTPPMMKRIAAAVFLALIAAVIPEIRDAILDTLGPAEQLQSQH